jgi:hypothetical protein
MYGDLLSFQGGLNYVSYTMRAKQFDEIDLARIKKMDTPH